MEILLIGIGLVVGLAVGIVVGKRKPAIDDGDRKEFMEVIDAKFAFSRDGLELRVNGYMVYEKVDDIKYGKLQSPNAIEVFAAGTIREIVGMFTFEEIICKRDAVNGELATKLTAFFDRWGLAVIASGINRVEVSVDALRAINDKIYIEYIKKAKPDDITLEILKLNGLEKVANGQATKIFGAESIDLLAEKK